MRRRSTTLSVSLWLVPAIAALAACGAASDGQRVRVVLITVDTLRLDSLTGSAAGMPHTNAFAERGQTFDRFFASTSTTQPTHASLLTGLHPWQHAVTRNGIVLDDGHETVAEHLSRAGFHTSAVVGSFPLEARFGFAQGFDEFHDDFHEPYVRMWEGEELEEGRFYSLANAVTEEALRAIDRASAPRQFFWFHYFDPHDPYGDTLSRAASTEDGSQTGALPALQPLPIAALFAALKRGETDVGERVQAARALYDRDVRAMDGELGRLFARLRSDEGEYETHVVFTSDHGESFGEAGCLGHGKRLTREQIQVPLVLVSPRLSPGRREDVAGSIDVASTILSLAGIPPSLVPGRDLSGDPAADASATVGMRRTFAAPKSELLVDGTILPVEGARFFVVHDGVLYSGDMLAVVEEDRLDRPVPAAESADVRALFETCELLLEGTQAAELLDDDVQRALEKLGYTR